MKILEYRYSLLAVHHWCHSDEQALLAELLVKGSSLKGLERAIICQTEI